MGENYSRLLYNKTLRIVEGLILGSLLHKAELLLTNTHTSGKRNCEESYKNWVVCGRSGVRFRGTQPTDTNKTLAFTGVKNVLICCCFLKQKSQDKLFTMSVVFETKVKQD